MGGKLWRLALPAVLGCVVALPLSAQISGDGYMFGEPTARLSVRGGLAHASAGSDVFDEVTNTLTLKKGDFSGFTAGVELGIRLTRRLELSLDGGYAGTSAQSEYRHFVDNNNLPIQQTTTFRRVPLTANLRMYLAPRGREIGRLAWIPAKVVPWIGVGGGTMWYLFRQEGDFIDFNTNNVSPLLVESKGFSAMAQGMGGVDLTLTPVLALTGDVRYIWAKANLDRRSFADFQRIDLSGVQATLGLTFRL